METKQKAAPTAEEISAITRETNYGTWRFQRGWKPLYVADAEGCWFVDGAGKRYLDFSSQLMCVNLGHKNPRVVDSIAEQARDPVNPPARTSGCFIKAVPICEP